MMDQDLPVFHSLFQQVKDAHGPLFAGEPTANQLQGGYFLFFTRSWIFICFLFFLRTSTYIYCDEEVVSLILGIQNCRMERIDLHGVQRPLHTVAVHL